MAVRMFSDKSPTMRAALIFRNSTSPFRCRLYDVTASDTWRGYHRWQIETFNHRGEAVYRAVLGGKLVQLHKGYPTKAQALAAIAFILSNS